MFRKIAIATGLAVMAFVSARAQEEGAATPVPQKSLAAYGSNILRLAPVTVMDIGLGFGASYERILGRSKMIGIVLPVSLLLEHKDDLGTQYGSSARYNVYVYFTPGVKIYPFGQHKVTYAVGPNLLLGYGGGSGWQYRTDPYGGMLRDDVKTTRFRMGVLINNYVNFQVSKAFNIGLEGGLGMRYIDRISYSGTQYYAGNGDFSNGFDITGQFSFTLGYRF